MVSKRVAQVKELIWPRQVTSNACAIKSQPRVVDGRSAAEGHSKPLYVRVSLPSLAR